MKIGYLTTDEVNQHLALELAAACSATLEIIWPRDLRPDGRFDAVLYDLDCLPTLEREQLLSGLLAGPAAWPVALHSYNLDAHQLERLQANGIAVYRSLALAVLQSLVQAAAPVARPAGLQPTAETRRRLAAQPS